MTERIAPGQRYGRLTIISGTTGVLWDKSVRVLKAHITFKGHKKTPPPFDMYPVLGVHIISVGVFFLNPIYFPLYLAGNTPDAAHGIIQFSAAIL